MVTNKGKYVKDFMFHKNKTIDLHAEFIDATIINSLTLSAGILK